MFNLLRSNCVIWLPKFLDLQWLSGQIQADKTLCDWSSSCIYIFMTLVWRVIHSFITAGFISFSTYKWKFLLIKKQTKPHHLIEKKCLPLNNGALWHLFRYRSATTFYMVMCRPATKIRALLRVIEKSISYCTVIDANNAQNAKWRHYLFGAIALKTPLTVVYFLMSKTTHSQEVNSW